MTDGKLPDPLVPPEVNLEGLGFIPMKLRVLKSTLFLKSTGDEFKAAFALWVNSWSEIPAGSLPDDEVVLEALSCSKVWAKVRGRALHNWIKCSDGRLYHPVVAELALDAWERRDEFREKLDNKEDRRDRYRARVKELSEQLRHLGVVPPRNVSLKKLEAALEDARSGRKASTHASTPSPHASPQASPQASTQDAVGMPLTVGGTVEGTVGGTGSTAASSDAPATPAPAASPQVPPEPVRAERGKRLPKDWALPKSWGEWALQQYPHWTADAVRQIALKFRNHWTSVSGKGATKLDWERTWQNWCMDRRTQLEHPAPRGGALIPLGGPSPKNTAAEAMVFGGPLDGVVDEPR